ncbi:uncharacterized protein LOC135367811 [Ornithodoros turicata]|uniref:uncharacterized protein LOC135367811 n=1 Tax=Ornithodoros turicata TaxID=34597 RepID=UPI00313957D8
MRVEEGPEGPSKFVPMEHQEVAWDSKKDLRDPRNLASRNTKSIGGTPYFASSMGLEEGPEGTFEIWPQGTPRGSMGLEEGPEGPPKFGLNEHQEVAWDSKEDLRDLRSLASMNTKR